MSTVAVLFQVDGQAIAADRCCWITTAPCGCVSGLAVAVPGDRVIASEDDAWLWLVPNAEERRRDKAAGFTLSLGVTAESKSLMVNCQHEPKWGIEETPIPDGYGWAGESTSFGGSKRIHLVPGGGDRERHEYLTDTRTPLKALCGKTSVHWRSGWFAVDMPTCRKCEAAATKQATQ